MNICIPVTGDKGLDSPVSGHFGSAPCFAIIDSDSRDCRVIPNPNQHHGHGGCRPLLALAGQNVADVVVGGIGAGALAKLQAAGIRVWRANVRSAGEALTAFSNGTLTEMSPATACGGHEHGGPGHGHQCHGGAGQGGHGHGGHGRGGLS